MRSRHTLIVSDYLISRSVTVLKSADVCRRDLSTCLWDFRSCGFPFSGQGRLARGRVRATCVWLTIVDCFLRIPYGSLLRASFCRVLGDLVSAQTLTCGSDISAATARNLGRIQELVPRGEIRETRREQWPKWLAYSDSPHLGSLIALRFSHIPFSAHATMPAIDANQRIDICGKALRKPSSVGSYSAICNGRRRSIGVSPFPP